MRVRFACGSILLAVAASCSRDSVTAPTPDIEPSFGKTPAPAITIAKMPGLGGSSEAFSTNDAGSVVGYSTDATTRYPFAIRWQKQGSAWTLTRVGPPLSYAYAINEAGAMAGTVADSAAAWLPNGSAESLGLGRANAISNMNTVVGYSYASGSVRPAAWTRDAAGWSITLLDQIPGSAYNDSCLASANSVSDEGTIVGVVYSSDCAKQIAVVWMPKANPADGWEPASPLAGAQSMAQSIPYSIVGSTVVGAAWPCATLNGCARRAYRWSLTNAPGLTGALGSFDARANSVNSAGKTAGSYIDRRMHAIVWSLNASVFQTLPEFNGYDAHWVWDINNPSGTGTSFIAAGGATDGRGGRYAVVWTMPY